MRACLPCSQSAENLVRVILQSIESGTTPAGAPAPKKIVANCVVLTTPDASDPSACEQIIAHNLKCVKLDGGGGYVPDPDSAKEIHAVGETVLFTAMERALGIFASGRGGTGVGCFQAWLVGKILGRLAFGKCGCL